MKSEKTHQKLNQKAENKFTWSEPFQKLDKNFRPVHNKKLSE